MKNNVRKFFLLQPLMLKIQEFELVFSKFSTVTMKSIENFLHLCKQVNILLPIADHDREKGQY